jgi:hypothetical protein
MKNILKALVIFASVVAFSSANAGVLEVTGTAKATYVISGSDSTTAQDNNGKGIGITNELAFTGTGELDNGWTWKYQVELDDTTASTFTASDDTRLELTTPYGTFAAYNTEGGLSTKYNFSAAAYGTGTDNGNSGYMQYGTAIDSYNNLQYHTPAGLLPFGIQGKVAVSPSADSGKNSGNSAGAENSASDGNKVTQYQLTAAPIDGLTVGASYLEKSGESGSIQGYETGGYYAKYTIGQVTVGAGQHFIANNISTVTSQTKTTEISTAALAATVKSFENQAYSVGFAVNDNLSLSYEVESSEAQKRGITVANRATTDNSVELEVTTVQAAYTMGGMTVSLSMKDIENDDYVLAKDAKETLIAVAMAF